MTEYNLHSEFDMLQHKAKYTNYLEVLIEADGHVLYAVPSHQELAIRLACEKHGITREELDRRCPPEYYCDFLTWVLAQTGAVSVWTQFFIGTPNEKQTEVLKRMKDIGIYKGRIDG